MENKILSEEDLKKIDKDTVKKITDIENIILETLNDFHNQDFIKYINNYKRYLEFIGDRLANIEPWQTNVNYPLVSSTIDTMFANIFDFGYQFSISESKLQNLCVESFDFRGSGRQAIKEAAKECLIVGKAYTRDFFLKEKESHNILNKIVEIDLKIPSMEYISVFDVMYDRTKGLKKSPFKIIRTLVTGDYILTKVIPLFLSGIKKGETEKIQEDKIKNAIPKILEKLKDNQGSRFSPYDYNSVKSLTSDAQFIRSFTDKDKLKSGDTFGLPIFKSTRNLESTTNETESKYNYYLSEKKSTYELVEYTTKDDRYVFVNGKLLWFGPNKYYLGDIREIMFSNIPGTGNSSGIADNLGGLQDIQNMLWNSFLDNIKLTMSPMFKVTGAFPLGKDGKLDVKALKVFRTTGQTDIEKISLGQVDFSPINALQLTESTSEKRSGVNEYITGGQGRAERVAGGIDLIFNQYKSKLTPITDSIDQMMADISRSWILMYLRFFTQNELATYGLDVIVNKEGVTINGQNFTDIINEKNISFSYNSLDKMEKESHRKTIQDVFQFLLQYGEGKVNVPELIKAILGKNFDFDNILLDKPVQDFPPNEYIPPEQKYYEEDVAQKEETTEDLIYEMQSKL